MRIVWLLTQSLESPSGLGRYWPLSKALSELGHEVTILALHHDFCTLTHRCFIKDGVQVHYLGQMHVFKRGNQKEYFSPLRLFWIAIEGTRRLTKAALWMSTDVIHLAKPHPMNGIAGWITHQLRDIPLYLDCDDYEAGSNRFSGSWQRLIVTLFENNLPFATKGVTANTWFTIDRLKRLGYPAGRIIYVPNGVDRERFSNINHPDADALRQQLNLEGRKVVLYLGSLSLISHSLDLLFEAFAVVRRIEPRAILVLVGGGEDYRKLYNLAENLKLGDSIRFVGWVPPDRAPLYYLIADVSVEPARDTLAARGRSPLKLFESWASGTPCVTTDVGDRRYLLGHPPAGKLVHPDANSLAYGILDILQNPEEAERIRRLGLERITSFFWDQLVLEFLRVYDV